MHTATAGSNTVAPNPMYNKNKFKLGLFSVNADGGLAFTTVENRWRAEWDAIERMALTADRAGLEFLLPIARWKGYGGVTDARAESFETLTHGAALAAITKRICIFSTVHAPLVHPVFAAKALSTIDHVSRGRAGLNIVCGWNQDEFDMFGQRQLEHDKRYDQGLEWYNIIIKIFAGGSPFDFKGEFYDLKAVTGRPMPIQMPRPFTMSAAFSPAGRSFAVQTSDMLFTMISDEEKARKDVQDIQAQGRAAGRDVGVFTTSHVVCRETDTEAEEYYRYYAEEKADHGAVDFHMKAKQAHYSKVQPEFLRIERRSFAGGTGTYPLIGSPQRIADKLIAMHRLGFAGTTISFVNFNDELPFFVNRVLPLLEQEGLRAPA